MVMVVVEMGVGALVVVVEAGVVEKSASLLHLRQPMRSPWLELRKFCFCFLH